MITRCIDTAQTPDTPGAASPSHDHSETENQLRLQRSDSDRKSETDTAGLLDAAASVYRRFVVMEEAERDVLALWTLHTYVPDSATATPFIAVTSAERESGKTRLLEIAELRSRFPLRAASMSAAVLYTKVQEACPTLLLDELDAVFGPRAKKENEELRGLLNAGNRRGSKAYRVSWVNGKRITEQFRGVLS